LEAAQRLFRISLRQIHNLLPREPVSIVRTKSSRKCSIFGGKIK
jgi:hypothetical protein